jgi:hypothetical protein
VAGEEELRGVVAGHLDDGCCANADGRVGGVKNAFGAKTFSPLKRDRRVAGASFLV